MKKKNLFLAAIAVTAMAGCTSDDFVGNQSLREANEQAAITFGFDVPTATRASGSDAATALGYQFIVYGEKSETDGNAAAATNLVFPNYQVNYTSNSAYTTTSNTKDWEYVGATHSSEYQSNITTKAGSSEAVSANSATQTIKYWDYGATNYVFTAISAKQSDITNGYVKIQKNTSGDTKFDKGYTLTLTSNADPSKIYISERNEISHTTGADRTAVNAYGGNVTMKFRNLLSQVRVGIYENIPGYTVTIKKFYYVDAASPAFSEMTTEGTDKFYANVPNIGTSNGATLTITYYDSGESLNWPKVAVGGSATTANYIALGGEDANTTGLKANATVGESATTPTFNETSGAYSPVFPQPENTANLKLKLDYILTSPTGETINVTGATAEIPGQYLAWKLNYKYTYLFKISDNTNGSTGTPGTDPAGLYPITFDAMEVISDDGTAEYITTVSEPSITTYAKASAVVTDGEYKAGETIYAVVEDGGSLSTLDAENMRLYTVTTSDATNFPITEASVAEAIAEYDCMTAAERTEAKIKFVKGSLTYDKTVVAEDGTTKEMHTTNNVVASFTGAAITSPSSAPQYYAIEYVKTPATYSYDEGKSDYTSEETFTAAGPLFTRSGEEGSYTYTKATTWIDGTTYYKRTAVIGTGTYAYKIVKVVP